MHGFLMLYAGHFTLSPKITIYFCELCYIYYKYFLQYVSLHKNGT